MKSDQYESEGTVERSRHLEESAVARFAGVMRAKLRLNARKPHWGSTPLKYLFERLQDEVAELDVALRPFLVPGYFTPEVYNKNRREVEMECADVANVVMIIFDNLTVCADREESPDPATAERERICTMLLDQAKGLREVAEREFEGHPGLKAEQRIKARALSDVVYDIRETAVGGRFG